MTLAKGVNSYLTVEEADVYFETRLDVAAWSAASEAEKAMALVTATSMLDDMHWGGYVVSPSQPLAFPRVGNYFDPRIGYQVAFPSEVPKRVLKGLCELAYHLLNNDGLLDNTGSVESINVGSVVLSNIKGAAKIPMTVRRLINPMLQNGGAGVWWRAN